MFLEAARRRSPSLVCYENSLQTNGRQRIGLATLLLLPLSTDSVEAHRFFGRVRGQDIGNKHGQDIGNRWHTKNAWLALRRRIVGWPEEIPGGLPALSSF